MLELLHGPGDILKKHQPTHKKGFDILKKHLPTQYKKVFVQSMGIGHRPLEAKSTILYKARLRSFHNHCHCFVIANIFRKEQLLNKIRTKKLFFQIVLKNLECTELVNLNHL